MLIDASVEDSHVLVTLVDHDHDGEYLFVDDVNYVMIDDDDDDHHVVKMMNYENH